MGRNIENLTNRTFGGLRVLGLSSKMKSVHHYWHCICSCGNEVDVRADYLKNGHTKSCGCKKISKPEEEIAEWLKIRDIYFKREFQFDDCLGEKSSPYRFDFMVFDDMCEEPFLIEYHGKHHYKPIKFFGSFEGIQSRDNAKAEYCAKNGIRLEVIKKGQNIDARLREIFGMTPLN